ncbi:uncharacterized protein C8orf74 homolog isoform X2 [Hemicordylus capensis]|uniref:uncharacterized protein C8orf74 homolog isoform X2 n=1 Tax=Hemicordylus capensis TaxID=884348 RepID=UPI002302906A|nr:uncharacterized protein C8orf74 homolog isoform X2 [Hemicordylus capensis]XP_053104878.1 uncharacterized protein C8orf74 homolog isoform X2 [Hemicordylus capensis]XP_053104884.1 uncharacterized protein C8orf74 homolog isoform X2 [Hemicordylus capensis]XP_053104886.1 uncharacterized protein C8orf74 homolog isoform X2 [Hemicordylus capensis]
MANLSAEGVEAVIQLEQKQGRQYLRELLGWKEFDEIRDLRRSIQLDLHYRSLVFAAEKGLPWPAVAEVGRLMGELLEGTKGVPIPEVINILQGKLSAFPVKLPPFQLCAIYDYFHNTLIKQYWLYQFTLTQERNHHQRFASLEVCAPPQPLPLREGTEIGAWKYQEQLAALSAAEDQKRANMVLIRKTLQREREQVLQRVYGDVSRHMEALGKETLSSLVREAIKAQIQNLSDILQNEIQTTFEILQLKLQKKALTLNPPAPNPLPPIPEGRRMSKALKANQEKSKESKEKGKKKKKK